MLAQKTAYGDAGDVQSCFSMEKISKVMQIACIILRNVFFTKSTKLEKENFNVFAHISGLR